MKAYFWQVPVLWHPLDIKDTCTLAIQASLVESIERLIIHSAATSSEVSNICVLGLVSYLLALKKILQSGKGENGSGNLLCVTIYRKISWFPGAKRSSVYKSVRGDCFLSLVKIGR